MRTNALRLLAALFAFSLIATACGDDEETTEVASSDDMADMDMADEDHDHEGHGDHEGHDHADHMDGEHGHDHGPPVEFEGADVPTVEVDVTSDPLGGIGIHVTTTNFTVAPEAASTEHVEGEGHFHLWIDGTKVQRFYNESIHYEGVVEGEVEVMVELSANDHRSYAVDGELITAMTTFDVPAHDHGAHDHGASDTMEFAGDAPELAIEVIEDPKSGYNALITLSGMELSAENASGDHVDGEGHLHLYVNGQKIARLYGTAAHIPVLPDGDVEISVEAFTNDHMAYTSGGDPITASTTITVAS